MRSSHALRLSVCCHAATSGTFVTCPDVGIAAAYTLGRGGLIVKIAQLLTAEAQHFKQLGLDVWPLGSPRRFMGADLVHAHGLKAGWLGLPIAWMYRVPLVVTWHNAVLGDGLAPSAARQTQRAVAMGADLTLAASSDLVE